MKNIKIEDLRNGYTYDEKVGIYSCIFCDEDFEEGYIYNEGYNYITAKKAMELHIEKEHKGIIRGILNLDKDITGITDTQKKIIFKFLERKNTKEIAKELEISEATVRSSKFYLQKLKNQAKYFVALMDELDEFLKEENCLSNEEEIELEKILETDSIQMFLKDKNLK